MPVDVVALGARIKALRESLGYSIGKAAKRAAITSAYWHAIENATPSGSTGRASNPSVPVLRAIADALDADRVELLELAGYDEDAAFDRARNERLRRTTRAASVDRRDLVRPEDQPIIDQLIDNLIQLREEQKAAE